MKKIIKKIKHEIKQETRTYYKLESIEDIILHISFRYMRIKFENKKEMFKDNVEQFPSLAFLMDIFTIDDIKEWLAKEWIDNYIFKIKRDDYEITGHFTSW